MKKKFFPYLAALALAAMSGCVRYDFPLTLNGEPPREFYFNNYDIKLKIGGDDDAGYYRGPGVKNGYFSALGLEEGVYTIEHVGFLKIGTGKIKVVGQRPIIPDPPSQKCVKCRDTGLIACERCAKCADCHGKRVVACGSCEGSGKIKRKLWFGSKSCDNCDGKGAVPCPKCRACERCGGSGKVPCPDCVAE